MAEKKRKREIEKGLTLLHLHKNNLEKFKFNLNFSRLCVIFER